MAINLDTVDRITEKYRDDTTAFAALLQDINNEFRYLPREALERVSEILGIPLSQLFSLATFYKSFNLVPRGKHEIHVCMGTACHVRGAQRILERIGHKLQVKPGDTTSDGEYTLDTVNCVGACALGPLVTIDGKYYGKLTLNKADKLLGGFHEKDNEPS
jgi:NADH-quinone oxidoreductase subunit E